ncbi:folic acid synthesis protein [Neohortaea acidophila]|uniref:Folic acid synthesis protein FOL1 n=1 Tax=Neohortaea acidophila TaxID=245834 RepID=A0A6A6PZP3_9PEZI|nr:folic acid synthesis protein [Neohortaea acidophila]KAF2485216.1 folic acid synthesis protein [Neohortaea acidophila]
MSTHDASQPNPEDEDSTTFGRVYIALGSNVGDRLQNIENACRLIDADADMRILRTSPLYETAPMYVEDQGRFLNGACEITTTLDPMSLLDRLQGIEKTLGREKMIDKGPRNIDLDILMFRNEQMKTERLTIPHALMLEREFVLRPLCDIVTAKMRGVPGVRVSTLRALHNLVAKNPPQAMFALTNLGHEGDDIRSRDPRFPTRIMSIVNVTPDSFSDGGHYKPNNLETFRTLVKAQIAAGASIIDVGGQSSRPNAPDVTAEEEIARVLPAIEAIKALPEAAKVSISVDTYRAAVAEAAVKAGAHIVNDISGGTLDPDMFATVARLGCTYVLMHMRGTPATMMSEENCSYPQGLIETVKGELQERIEEAMLAGIRRWRIILDPGIGFSKTVEQNVELLRKFRTLTSGGSSKAYAWLAGSSRKSFIGKVTGVEDPKDRALGTAATVTAAIQGGAHIVRVHDAGEMSAVVKMADAIYRA